MRFAIVKCHGSGNDFPLIDARRIELSDRDWSAVARALADRRGPVGGDGLLLLTDRAGHAGFRMFNPDGSEAETCLNGVRCVARMAFEAGGGERLTLHLAGSLVDVTRDTAIAPGVFTVRETAGPASLDVATWPLTGEGHEIIDRPIDRLSPDLPVTAVAIPNPHLVAFVDAIDEVELVRLGSICEAAPDWLPNRANLSFVRVGADGLYVRTFERGAGLTESCGSAMAASTFAAGLTGRVGFGRRIVVRNRGGLVHATAAADGMVTLSGNATWEWEGSVAVDLQNATAGDLSVTRRYPEEIAAWDAAVTAAA